tara:strand:- start:1200 stop:1385 length:186 start_codon:yes stop_codon:yes gene_type:complete
MGEIIMIQPVTEHQLYNKLAQHSECSTIEIANYANGENIAVECVNCSEVIFDIDRPIYGGE